MDKGEIDYFAVEIKSDKLGEIMMDWESLVVNSIL